jgi:hypothetical protein
VVLLDTTFYSFYPRYFYGGIREENKRIYFYHPYLGSESLVFDFNHVVGDTIFYDVCQSCGLCDMILSSIDSVQLVDGSYRRRFNFYPDAMYPYIEGIGSSAGILSICVPPGGPGALSWELTCFRVHDTLLYYQNATENCSIITSVEPVVHVNNNISIHPTPFNSVVTIEFGKIIREGTLEVRNLAGQIVLKERISNSDMEIIPAECFQTNGIYFLTVKAEDKVYCSKLVCER